MSKDYGFKVMRRQGEELLSAIIHDGDVQYQCRSYNDGQWSSEPDSEHPLLAYETYEAAKKFARENMNRNDEVFEIWLIQFEVSYVEDFRMWGGDSPFAVDTIFCQKVKLIKHLSSVLYAQTTRDYED